MIDLSLAGAQGKPLFSYTKKTYTCAGNVVNVPGSIKTNNGVVGAYAQLPLVGAPVSETVTVITADTNSVSAAVNAWSTGGTNSYDQTTGAITNLQDTINLKITGTRMETTSGSSGSQSGDTLITLPANGWIDNAGYQAGTGDVPLQMFPTNYDTLSINVTNPTGCAVWTVEQVVTR
jgi:hypothetical protein